MSQRLRLARLVVPFIVLAIGCANVAGVQLARAVGRTHELAIRASLGASRAHVLRLLVFETACVSVAAGLGAWTVSTQVLRLSGRVLPIVASADARVFAFSLALPVLVTLLAGLFPAWRATGFHVPAGLRLGPRVGRVASPRLRRAVVGGQVALSVALLGTAVYLIRGLGTVPSTLGRFQEDVLVVDVSLGGLEFDEARTRLIHASILDRIRALPGVTAAASGAPLLTATNGPVARHVTPEWFQAAGLRILAGRSFSAGDADGAVINDTWAERLGGTDAALRSSVRLVDASRTPAMSRSSASSRTAITALSAVGGIALLATIVPARRMLAIDPSDLLRGD